MSVTRNTSSGRIDLDAVATPMANVPLSALQEAVCARSAAEPVPLSSGRPLNRSTRYHLALVVRSQPTTKRSLLAMLAMSGRHDEASVPTARVCPSQVRSANRQCDFPEAEI